MLIFFITPFYAVFALAFGTIDPIWRNAVPVWNPLNWNPTTFNETIQKILPPPPNTFAPAFIRTFVFVVVASALCLVVGYPVAYFVARYGGKFKNLYLVLLIAPFWISYMMRMLAWVNILQPDGYLNQLLSVLSPGSKPVTFGWLEGHWYTVVLGIVYGYIPYMILPLYAGLDRISQSLLEGSRDLGANGAQTFFRVTLPLSKPAILAGMVIVTLPMFGDYYTNNLLSRRPTTTMIGNLIDGAVNTASRQPEGAVLVIVLSVLLLVPMLYYMRTTMRESERW